MRLGNKKWLAVALLLGILALFGCSKTTRENYEKLKVGMPYDAVVQILGDPDDCRDAMGARSCTWGDDKTQIKIQFIADKVVIFSAKGLK